MLVQRYFATEGIKAQFTYKQHTAFLVSISKQGSNVKVVTNQTGVIVSMINSQYGFIKFGAGEKALFSRNRLYLAGQKLKFKDSILGQDNAVGLRYGVLWN